MRTTLNIEDRLMDKASKMTGIKEKTALVKLGLEALIARESAELAKLGGTQKQLRTIPKEEEYGLINGPCGYIRLGLTFTGRKYYACRPA